MNRVAITLFALSTLFARVAVADELGALRGSDTPAYGAPVGLSSAGDAIWTGAHVGVNVGYGGGQEDFHYSVPYDGIVGNDRQTSSGVVGGAQIGYDFALSRGVVLGVETDFDGASITNSAPLNQPSLGAQIGNHVNYFGTVRGRVGYAFDRFMAYATGGFAYANVTTTVSAPAFAIADSSSHMHMGYAVGGGLQYAVTESLRFRTEYLRLQYDSRSTQGMLYTLGERPADNIVRVGLDYKFSPFAPAAPAPLLARY